MGKVISKVLHWVVLGFIGVVAVRDIWLERSGYWMWLVWRWFDREWWKYLTDSNSGWVNIWCRVRGHPAGVWWYNSSSYCGPDMRCKNCEEWIG